MEAEKAAVYGEKQALEQERTGIREELVKLEQEKMDLDTEKMGTEFYFLSAKYWAFSSNFWPKLGKMIDLTSKLGEISDIDPNKSSTIYPQIEVILDCIMPIIPLKHKYLSIILIWVIVSHK